METTQSLQLYYPSTAPSSPRASQSSQFYYTSAPTSPSRADFSFNLPLGFNSGSQFSSADELFEGGKLRPFLNSNPPAPLSSSTRFTHLEKEEERRTGTKKETDWGPQVRGRTVSSLSTTTTVRKIMARSVSPIGRNETESETLSSPASKKWRLKDFFLFRSASEGRATSRKDPLRKYTFLSDNNSNKNGSMRKDSSPQEKHYLKKRDEMKRKTPLPFHQTSLFGYLKFNPAINSISKRFN
ncbi:hypothetical protein LUZ60_008661 [Juncus effusus]|nr:hypothetical protein LUZ60_008661 [Juncus effusus]